MVLERASPRWAPEAVPPSIPVTLHELLLARLDMLPSRQKALAQLCAVVGRDFTACPARRLWGARRAVALQRDLVRAAWRRGCSGSSGRWAREPRYQFRHALIQEAAYQSLSRRTPARVPPAHRARCWRTHSPRWCETRPEVLAHHYTEAGELEPAIHYWTQAGRHASLQSANQEAVGYLSGAEAAARPAGCRKRLRESWRSWWRWDSPIQMKGYPCPRGGAHVRPGA